MGDSTDPCPNAAPRPRDDADKIIAASLDARYFLEDWGAPAILEAGDRQPFELYGYSNVVIWKLRGRRLPLDALHGGGVLTISFHSPRMDSDKKAPMIEYGPDRNTARTMINRYLGGLNADGYEVSLRKTGDEWFVVDLVMKWIS